MKTTHDQRQSLLRRLTARGHVWRTGSKLFRTIYRGSDVEDFVGICDLATDAATIVDTYNVAPDLITDIEESMQRRRELVEALTEVESAAAAIPAHALGRVMEPAAVEALVHALQQVRALLERQGG